MMFRYMKFLPFVLLLVLITACGTDSEEKQIEKAKDSIDANMSEDVLSFNYTTQDDEELSNEDLKGKWWVADFVFTNCETVCIPMTSNMSSLQDKAADKDLDVQFVSFSIDPEHDTPEVLRDYAKEYKADTSNWTFLTGYDFDEIKKLSIKSFKSIAEMPKEGDQVIHGTRFYLVSPEGKVVKGYNGTDQKELDQIIKDLNKINK